MSNLSHVWIRWDSKDNIGQLVYLILSWYLGWNNVQQLVANCVCCLMMSRLYLEMTPNDELKTVLELYKER